MMGAAMLKHHQFMQSLWASYSVPFGKCMWGSQAQPLLMYYNNTFHQGVCNDGGSHVEMSLICVVPLGVAKMCMRGSQAQPLLTYYKNTFHQGVCNDGGSHVEMSLICAVPLGVAKMCTRGSQAQPLYLN